MSNLYWPGPGSGRIGNKNLLLWACWSSFQSFWGTGFSRICNCWIFFSAEDTPSAYSSLRRFSARSLASFAPSAGGFGSAFGRPRANLPRCKVEAGSARFFRFKYPSCSMINNRSRLTSFRLPSASEQRAR